MNSGEIARLAGVSVRTLRHYHQVGVLPEPARRGNGYREYTVRDLILLLRVRRLAELGVPLDEIPALLDSGDRADSALAELDRELAAQIDRLTARRDVIARLRAAGASPDTPPDLAGLLFAAPGIPPDLARHDHDLSILVHHLLDEAGRRELAGFFELFTDPVVLAEMTALVNRFHVLDADTPAADVDQLLADYRAALSRLAGGHVESFAAPDAEKLFVAYQDQAFNAAQRAFLARLAG